MTGRKVYDDHPAVEFLGLGFLVYYNVLGVHRHIARRALERAGISELQPDQWYKRQIILDVLREVERRNDPRTLFEVGKELATYTPLPPEITTFEQLLGASAATYPQYQRNLPAHDFIRAERDGVAWLYAYHTPWPSQGIRGYLWQMFTKFRVGQRLQTELVQGTEDAFERTFRLSW
jgi:hypothetical protein